MTGKIQPNAAGGAIFDRFAFSGMAPPCWFTVAGCLILLALPQFVALRFVSLLVCNADDASFMALTGGPQKLDC